jgi:hypothetical protein
MKTIHTLLIAGAAFLPALGMAQNDRQPKTQESRTEVKVIISADDNGKKEHKEMKMIVLNDSLITINCEELGKKLKTVDINMPESNGQMDIVIREDGKAPQHIRLDLEKMGKELEQITKQGKELSEDEINRIIERYLPDIEDMNVLIDKQMQVLEVQMEDLEKELGKLEGMEKIMIEIDGMEMDTVLNEVSVSEDGKTVKRMVLVRANVNVSDLTDKDWNSIRKREGEKKMNTMKVDRLEFYPNPSDGKFNVNFSSPEKGYLLITVMDMNGKMVYEERVPDFQGTYSKAYDLSTVGRGMYILRMTIGKNSSYKKLVIE